MNFSARNRQNLLQGMQEQVMDVLIIGGGITGAGIALDAAERGMSVGLIEKNDFGSGTSSRSTKLIHGGLRYLKQGDVKLVQEVGRERTILYKNAPHLVIPAPMLLPIYKGGTYGYLMSSIGLYVYDWLAGVAWKERRKMLGRKKTMELEPLLKTEGLKGAGLYFEYRTDDARLTLDIMKTASMRGAQAVNYAEAVRFLYRDGKAVGVEVRDRIGGCTYKLHAKHIVNATGPWVDDVRKLDGSMQGKRLFLTKGVHLVFDSAKLPVKQSAYFDTPDGRMVFVIPRSSVTYVGTTDTAYDQLIDSPRTTLEDRDYLLRAVNSMFPSLQLTPGDVRSHWAGLRPLIYEEGRGPSELSRKDEIFHSSTGLITIAGGKLTGFRKMAEKVVDLVAQRIHAAEGRMFPGCTTDKITISGGENMGKGTYAVWKNEMLQSGVRLGVSDAAMQEWIDIYGTGALAIAERFAARGLSGLPQGQRELFALVSYAVENEMTVTAVDFVRLRTGWSYFQLSKAEDNASQVLKFMEELLGWDAVEQERQGQELERLFRSIRELPANDKAVGMRVIGEDKIPVSR
ncbi:glycerol-3-phosphate dehydrogenase/oxidase [Paenibacillus caui]|uniref:glycerol-3-phosphate dehydrogenase/oxidase n=1 Tax=Paenibacillus caui TaxID=2873927 RepID=UPI001CA950E5|nr:glycerol-3-phosphate dehydrogenase/oxidase [Paenibacillus caui]